MKNFIYLLLTALVISCTQPNSNRTASEPNRTAITPDFLSQLSDSTVLIKGAYNLSGLKNIRVKYLDLNGSVLYSDLPTHLQPNENEYLLLLDSGGVIRNGTIRGANGRAESPYEGYFGAVNVLHSGKIDSVRFVSCDKWAIRHTGSRYVTSDTLFIRHCTFDSTARNGYGYGIWNHYGTTIIDSCLFYRVRHGVDCGSEGNKTEVRNSDFRHCFYIPIHQHRYKGDSVGMGMIVRNNRFYDNLNPVIDIGVPFSGRNLIDGNYFVSSKVGITGRDSIRVGTNRMNGEGMAAAPTVTGRTNYQVGEKMTLKASGYSKYTWNNGVTGAQTTTTFKLPMVKCYSVYGTGIADTTTVLAQDTGSYFGFYAMGTGVSIEIYSGDVLLKTIPPSRLKNYDYYLVRSANVWLRVVGNGVVYFDNVVKNGGFYDTFEEGVKVKIKYGQPVAKVSRVLYNQLDGYRCLRLEFNGSMEVR